MRRASVVLAAVLAGCVTVDPQVAAEAARPVTCASQQECDLYWKRAQIWVTRNSAWRIQMVTDTVLTTYGPSSISDVRPGYSLTKVPNGDGSAQIDVGLLCLDGACGFEEEVASLKRYMVAGQ